MCFGNFFLCMEKKIYSIVLIVFDNFLFDIKMLLFYFINLNGMFKIYLFYRKKIDLW